MFKEVNTMIEKTIDGFDIPKRVLTEEESARPITLERFNEYHHRVGEDFVDQHTLVDAKVMGGWLLAKYPNYKLEILKAINDHPIEQDYLHMYEESFDRGDYDTATDKFYSDFAEFLNLTVAAKKRVNQILIQIKEYYPNTTISDGNARRKNKEA